MTDWRTNRGLDELDAAGFERMLDRADTAGALVVEHGHVS
jgi:hypothetical protein